MSRHLKAFAAGLVCCLSLSAQASIFGDNEARLAIIDLRQRLAEVQKRQAEDALKNSEALARAVEENAQLRRSLLELSRQIEQVGAELPRLRGQGEQTEQLARVVADVQRRLKDVTGNLEERLGRMEPLRVSVDGRTFLADPGEAREFEAALEVMRRGDSAKAQTAFAAFLQRYPASGYKASAWFWLGTAQYAQRNYSESLVSLRTMLAADPKHARASEAFLSVATAQLELKEPRAAVRKTLEDLIAAHPQSEAASVAKDRLELLK